MKTAADMLRAMTRPEAQRLRNWNRIMRHETDELERELATEAVSKQALATIMLSYTGGACSQCGREFRMVVVDTWMVKGIYYEPHEHCRCYVRCPRCHAPQVKGTATRTIPAVCSDCGWRLRRMKMGREEIRYGDALESQYDRTLDHNNLGRPDGYRLWCVHDIWDEKQWAEEQKAKPRAKKHKD